MAAPPPQRSPSTSSLRDQTNALSSTAPKRTKSVQFSSRDPSMSRSPTSRSLNVNQDPPTLAKGNVEPPDEITPIVNNERNGGTRRNYATTSDDSEAIHNHPPGGNPGPRTLPERRGQSGAAAEAKDSEGWWKDLVDKYGSVELDNKGSVARDHLALERTFLAWLRTSLAFASIGIAITQLFRLNTTISRREGLEPKDPGNSYHLRQVGKPLGATFMGIAIIVLLVGGRRYFESQYWIIRGKFPASRGSIFLITAIAAALIVASLVIVCTVDPSVFEKR
ncbi:MAG: hypothetical protein L6R40_004911 [Gallowayella cf. fulva]|nr:MAG: hypothetical protein L6R40_004911 [Xanthomendoza cf. fulva]